MSTHAVSETLVNIRLNLALVGEPPENRYPCASGGWATQFGQASLKPYPDLSR